MPATDRNTHTPSPWDFACDSYGKVRHSRKACVFQSGASTPTVVASRIPNWADARLIAAAPDMLEALRLLQAALSEYRLLDVRKRFSLSLAHAAAGAAIAKAEGR